MEKPIVIVTGCGFKPVEHVYKFEGKPTHNSIFIDGAEHKMNIGTAIAYYLSKKKIGVIMVSRTSEKLEKIKQGLIKLGCKEKLISYIASDLMTEEGIDNLIKNLPKNKNFYLVQSIGMGAGSYKVPNDNIYLPFEQISPELITNELSLTPAMHRLMLKIVKIFREQIKEGQKAKVAIITSMSGERGYHYGATHVAAKHALVGYIKGIERELKDEGIEIHDIRPGAIDTGMYDNPYTRKVVEEIAKKDKMWGGREPDYASPLNVAKKVYLALFSKNPKKIYKILAPYQK
ncbi:MAG: SDR family NAD(P)-dependent oxidoreductase [Nanoarchaeota archaeon]|nr:SDR family NAD(P)-dependent oxidoreductase [Nanoarchaeota archaeon]